MAEQHAKMVNTLSDTAGPNRAVRRSAGRSQVLDRIVKRSFDILVSLTGLILLSPLFFLVGLLIKLDSHGPVFYRGKRIGKDGKPFDMFKFRTMKDVPVDIGPRVTAQDDPRVTRLGRILRHTKLNEFPQLINVLKGEMSLVGPRPEDPEYVAYYTSEQRKVLSVPPGITSVASIVYRDEESMLNQGSLEETYVAVIMPHKLELDLAYLNHYSFLVDLDIIFRTILVLFPRFIQASPEIEELFFGPVQRLTRRYLSWFSLDLILGLLAVSVASFVWQRAGAPPDQNWAHRIVLTAGIAFVLTLANQICGLQHSLWLYASAQEVIDILLATTLSTTLLLIVGSLVLHLSPERILLSGFFAFALFTATRYRTRLVNGLVERFRNLRNSPIDEGKQRILVVGTGGVGRIIAGRIQSHQGRQRYQLVGFVDNDLARRGMSIRGLQVLGSCRSIPTLVSQHDIDIIVVTDHSVDALQNQFILDICHSTPARVKIIPDVLQFIRDTDEPSPNQ